MGSKDAYQQSRNVDELITGLKSLLSQVDGVHDYTVVNMLIGQMRLLGDQSLLRQSGESDISYKNHKETGKRDLDRMDREVTRTPIGVWAYSQTYDVLTNLLPTMNDVARRHNAEVPFHTNPITYNDVLVPNTWALHTIYTLSE